MKITRVETIRLDEFANLLWVRLHTDDGVIGLGETFFGPRAAEAYIHETAAPLLLGRDPLQIERIARDVERDFFMNAEQAKEYGVIDQIVVQRGGSTA